MCRNNVGFLRGSRSHGNIKANQMSKEVVKLVCGERRLSQCRFSDGRLRHR